MAPFGTIWRCMATAPTRHCAFLDGICSSVVRVLFGNRSQNGLFCEQGAKKGGARVEKGLAVWVRSTLLAAGFAKVLLMTMRE